MSENYLSQEFPIIKQTQIYKKSCPCLAPQKKLISSQNSQYYTHMLSISDWSVHIKHSRQHNQQGNYWKARDRLKFIPAIHLEEIKLQAMLMTQKKKMNYYPFYSLVTPPILITQLMKSSYENQQKNMAVILKQWNTVKEIHNFVPTSSLSLKQLAIPKKQKKDFSDTRFKRLAIKNAMLQCYQNYQLI